MSDYTRIPTATVLLDGRRWRGILTLSTSQRFGEPISSGTLLGRDPPVIPQIGMSISWRWGVNGSESAGFTGEIADVDDTSYPDHWQLLCKDVLFRADQSQSVLQTDPLNAITARDAIIYLLTHYGALSASRLSIPVLSASGSAWVGSEWVLGVLTPVQWGDIDTGSGATTALKAANEICSCLGYWLYADAAGIVRAKQMERRPSTSAREVFQRGVNLLVNGAPDRKQSYDAIRNKITVRGANTGVDGAQLVDTRRTDHPLLPSGVDKEDTFSSFLLEYENESEAGAASIGSVAARILNVRSRIPDVITARAKADANRKVGDTVGIIDPKIQITSQQNFFIYAIDRSLDLVKGGFDDQLTLDGGTGSSGYTTIPPPDASFSWQRIAETLDGTAVIEVFLDGSGSTSPTGEIVSYSWSTSTPTYDGTPTTASGVQAVFIFAATDTPAAISLSVTDTTSKIGTFDASVDLTGAGAAPPVDETVSGAAGAAWIVTPDGGATWNEETTNGDAIAVGIIGAGADDRAAGTAGTYGLVATRGSGGAGGLRQTLDTLASSSTNLVSNGAALTSNIWVNEANPARVWFAIGDTLYRSVDGGATKVAMAVPAPGTDILWVMEDAAVENSVFIACGADLLNATDPTLGWAVLYPGPIGATARQFVRSRDGQVTWICYLDAPSGQALQRVETGALADLATTDIRTLALDRNASSLVAALYAITADDPAQIWRFDGLTGLSAAQSTQTFPAGATVQHMLGSRLANLFYAADFDSIAPGQGAFRKYFPDADVLRLWKALDSGQQGHMLGLGGQQAGAAEIILLPYNTSGAADKIWRYVPGIGWIGLTPPYAGGYWRWIAANPFQPDSWLLLGNTGNSGADALFSAVGGLVKTQNGAHSPIWMTTDAGATWIEIDLPSPIPDHVTTPDLVIEQVEWSRRDASMWYTARQNTGILTSLWRGVGTTVAAPISDGTTVAYLAIVPGADDDVYFPASAASTNPDLSIYVDTTDTWIVPPGSAIGSSDATNLQYADYDPLSRRVIMGAIGAALYQTADYRAAQPTLMGGATLGSGSPSPALLGDTLFVGGQVGVQQVHDPFGAATIETVAFGTTTIRVLRADRQTHTACAARIVGAASIVLYANGAWSTFAGPDGVSDADLAIVLEVVVRT